MKELVNEDELVGRYRITGKFIGEGSFSQARGRAAPSRGAAPDRCRERRCTQPKA